MLTYGNAGMKNKWRDFLEKLPYKKTFLHKDEEWKAGIEAPDKLPAILLKDKKEDIVELVSAQELSRIQSLNELILYLQKRLEDYAENQSN